MARRATTKKDTKKEVSEETKVEEVQKDTSKDDAEIEETEVEETSSKDISKGDASKPKQPQTFEELYEANKNDKVIGSLLNALNHYVDIVYKQNKIDGHTIASMN